MGRRGVSARVQQTGRCGGRRGGGKGRPDGGGGVLYTRRAALERAWWPGKHAAAAPGRRGAGPAAEQCTTRAGPVLYAS